MHTHTMHMLYDGMWNVKRIQNKAPIMSETIILKNEGGLCILHTVYYAYHNLGADVSTTF